MEYSDEWLTDQFIAQITKARRVVDGLVGSEAWDENLPDLRNPLNRDLAIWHVATSIGLQTVRPPEVDEGESGLKLSITLTEPGDMAELMEAGSVTGDGGVGATRNEEEQQLEEVRSESLESDRSRNADPIQVDANGDPIVDDMSFSNVSDFKGLKGKQLETRSRGGTAGERELVSGFSGLKSERVIRRDPSVDRDQAHLAKSKAVTHSMFHNMEKETLKAVSASRSASRSPGRSPRRKKKIKSVFHSMEKETSAELQPPKQKKKKKKQSKADPGGAETPDS